MKRWTTADPVLARSALLAIGVGCVGNAYLLAASASPLALSPTGLTAPLIAAVALIATVVISCRRFAGAPPAALAAAAVVALPIVALQVLLALVPPIARDELTHHLAIPALYVRAGRVIELPFAEQSYYPMVVEMLYTPLLAWLPDNAPKFLHLLFGLATAAVVGAGAARENGPATGLLAALLVLATPVVALLGGSAYVDLGLALFTAVALLTLLRWFETQATPWLVLSALSAGFAFAAKYNGMMVVLLLSVGTVFAPARRRPTAVIAAGAAYGLLALLPVAPWLIKNLWQTGNPMYPLFHGIFGGRSLPETTASFAPLARRALVYGESWWEIAGVPLRVFLTGREGVPALFDGVLQPLFLVGIAAACWRGATRTQRFLLGFAATYFFIAFFQATMRVRYVIPIGPALALITAPTLLRMWNERKVIAVAAIAAGAAFSLVHVAGKYRETTPLDYLTGRQDRSTYVARFVPELPVVEIANATLPPNSRVYLAFLGTRSYYVHQPFTYDFYFSGLLLRRHVESAADAPELLAALRGDGITHMIAADNPLSQFLLDSLSPDALGRWQDFARAHLHRLASQNGVSLYEIGAITDGAGAVATQGEKDSPRRTRRVTEDYTEGFRVASVPLCGLRGESRSWNSSSGVS